ncbi:YidB family protein [Zoogloea dura]|jgi:uncharacterized protein YidB (DUF937 family)|uniref:DUF937 domain-containing protein n=1 Tax=Zoogloea dura TaxID=2728840 RepID=A0A848G1F5_9RHOO|nr:YidB family protein [Zoogloea dura]NML24875.1 DUF937 domain-containing protein [Zoogloea dura]
MGLFDQIAGQVLGSLAGGAQSGEQSPLLQIVMSLIQNSEGGLGGLLGRLGQAGLGEQVASWVGTGQNLPVTPEQLGQALERSGLGSMAAQLGVSGEQMASQLAPLLPAVVDGLTPNGQLPESSDELLAALGGFLGRS